MQRLEECLVTNNLTNKPVVICGDLNAPTASEDDFLVGDNNVPDMIEVSHVIDGDIGLQRVSKDKDINKFGRDLLQMCKTYDLYIKNGRFGADDFTFINQNGASVIDYFIVSKHLLTNTINFQVLSATESCHLLIPLDIDGQCNIPRPQEDTADTITYRYHLNRDDCDMYLRLISESILKRCFDKVDDLINISTDVEKKLSCKVANSSNKL